MRALIVGGDQITTARRELQASGYHDIIHWDGRKCSDLRRAIPGGLDRIVIMLGYVSHNLARRVKDSARARHIPVAFIGRKQAGSRQMTIMN